MNITVFHHLLGHTALCCHQITTKRQVIKVELKTESVSYINRIKYFTTVCHMKPTLVKINRKPRFCLGNFPYRSSCTYSNTKESCTK